MAMVTMKMIKKVEPSRMEKAFIIAEVAQAHEGSLGIAHSYIEALAETGVDAVKFQTHIAEAESSLYEEFRVNFSYEDKTRFDYWKRMEFSLEQWKGLKAHCEKLGMEFLSSPFSCEAVNLLEEVGVKRYKVGSGEISNYLLLEKLGRIGKPLILSSGMSDYAELEETLAFLKKFEVEVSLLQCTTAYPTQPKQWGLFEIAKLKERLNIPIGYSDHSGRIESSIAAYTLGASILEFHVVFDKKMFGPDAKASLEINQVKDLVTSVRNLQIAFSSSYSKNDVSGFALMKNMFGKSLSVNKDLPKGHLIQLEDLESKKPGNKGLSAKLFHSVIGKELLNEKRKWDFLDQSDF